jgi:Omp85 superfamily domain
MTWLQRFMHIFALISSITVFTAALAQTAPLPSFAELEAAGATFGEIRVSAQDIFDTRIPAENNALFRLANQLHIQTQPKVIERALLFKRGDPVTVRRIEEAERLLRSNRYLYDVSIRPLAVHDNNVVDVEVITRDTWSLDPGISVGRSGGSNTGSIQLREYNLLGTGVTLGLSHARSVDRTSNEVFLTAPRVGGSWTTINLLHGANSDGERTVLSVVRPFYALDARWAAGLSASNDKRIDPVYQGGSISSQYRHHQQQAEVFGGWSEGLVQGWTQRYSAGLSLLNDAYTEEPGVVAPPALPQDQKLVAPFLRAEFIEDRYERQLNRNLVGRPEFFALGLQSTMQLGYAAPSLGSSRKALLYSAAISRGFQPRSSDTLIASARLTGEYGDGKLRRQQVGAATQYYLPQGPRWLFYAGASGDVLTRPTVDQNLLLGGDNGLRGYPLRYQSGTRRALFTLEERFYTDLYVWQLFRIGGAAYIDVGRAWGAETTGTQDTGWLSNVGAGLRIVNARAAFNNVLHIDVAVPLNASSDIKRVQFLIKSRTSF